MIRWESTEKEKLAVPTLEIPFWIGDRLFDAKDLEFIERMSREFRGLSRTELAATVAENLPWKAPNGRLRVEASLLLLESLEAVGRIKLRPKEQPWGSLGREKIFPKAVAARLWNGSLATVRPVALEPVPKEELALWNATVAEYHPLGYRRPFGSHQRYWIKSRTYAVAGNDHQRIGRE